MVNFGNESKIQLGLHHQKDKMKAWKVQRLGRNGLRVGRAWYWKTTCNWCWDY